MSLLGWRLWAVRCHREALVTEKMAGVSEMKRAPAWPCPWSWPSHARFSYWWCASEGIAWPERGNRRPPPAGTSLLPSLSLQNCHHWRPSFPLAKHFLFRWLACWAIYIHSATEDFPQGGPSCSRTAAGAGGEQRAKGSLSGCIVTAGSWAALGLGLVASSGGCWSDPEAARRSAPRRVSTLSVGSANHNSQKMPLTQCVFLAP